MKTGAPKQRGGGPAKNRDLRSTPARGVTATPAAAVSEGSVLDKLDRVVARGSLADAWAAATAGGGASLPDQGVLERRFGTSLSGVEVHDGRRARSLLQRLGARGAARGQQVLVADASDRQTLVHEVAHTVQARHGGEGGGIVRADDEAEREAEHVALRLRGRGRLRLRTRIGRRSIALRRLRDPARGDLPPLTEEDRLEPIEAPERSPRRVRDEQATAAAPAERAQAEPEIEAEAEAAPASETAVPEEARGDEAQGGEAEAESGQAREATGEGELEQSPNRREAVDGLLEEQQENWDEGAETADDHEAEACPRHRVGEGEQPFARGPPLEVPATEAMPELDDPEPDAPDREELRRAERDVQTNLDAAPAASAVDGGAIDAETDAERRSQAQQVRGRVDRLLSRKSVDRPEDPTVALEGEADIEARTRAADERITTASQREGEAARTTTEEDFGEDRMAPVRDPTEGHDTTLDGLEVPDVDLEAQVDTATRDRIATAGNAGQLSLDEAVVVRQEEMTRVGTLATERGQRRDAIDEGIAESDRAFDRLCREGETQRQRVRTQTEGQVQERRQAWRRSVDDHVSTRQTEANTLVREKRSHAETLASGADRQAQDEIDRANTRATEQAADVERRARAKGEQSESRSWWQRGIDWVRERINDLVDWIDDFIDAAHRAIDAMLDAAADVAHTIVENGRQAVQATLDLAHRGVDVIADNLPGELGDLAREHRDDMHAFLDQQQAAVDAYADGLHEDIDTAIEDVRQDLHQGLEDFREGVHDVADAANEVLDVAENGIMAVLQRYFPEVAAFVEGGILGPVRRAGAQLSEWAQTALQATGLGDLQSTLQELHSTRFCQAQTEEEQAIDCAMFQARLEGMKANFEALLASPVAQQIQGMLQSAQDEQESQQVDAITGFFSFIRWVAEPVYQWWQSVEPQVSAALDWLGDMAQAAWEHIARALGLDVSLPPLEAIRQALEAAWEAIAQAAQPLISSLRRAWQWVVEDSPLASVIAFFRAIPEAISALGQLLGEMTDAAGEWLAQAAETLANTIMPIVNRALGAVADVLNAVVDRIVGWADQLLAAFDALLSWEAAHELLQAVVMALRVWATPVRLAIQLFRDCGERALRGLAHVVRNLAEYARTILDIVSGIVVLIVGFPATLIPWFAGTVWLYVVPDCYKAPILNFLLDMAIRFVQFFPEPADFMLGALYQGLLGFLQGLREAPDSQKVGAMNLMASLFAGNVEALAGFMVGLVEGVWEATGGTIVFLIQAAVWLISLPFKLIRWAAGLISGGGPGQARSRGDDTPERSDDEEAAREAEAEVGGSLGREMASMERGEQPRQRGPPSEETMRQAEALEQRAETEEEAPAPAPAVDEEEEDDVEPSTDVAAIERAGEDADTDAPAEEGGVSEGGREPSGSADPERPPAIPEAIAGLRGTLQQLMASGFTREDVQAALDGVRQTMRTFIGRMARTAAQQMLAALNAEGAAFAIGRAMGSVAGQLLVDVLLAVFTGGVSTGLTAARVALTGARSAGRLASVLRRVRSAIQPALRAMSRLRSSLGRVVGQLRRWLDDVVRWMRGVGRRVRARVGRMRGRAGRGRVGRGRAGRRGRGGRRGRRDRDGRRGRDRDGRRRDDETLGEKRRRLRRAVSRIQPIVQRMLDDGAGERRLQATLLRLRIRYRLSSLRVRGGRVIARINPTEDAGVVRQVPPEELGRLLRPVLQRAYRSYARRVRRNSDSRAALDRAEAELGRGGAGRRTVDAEGAAGRRLTAGEQRAMLESEALPPGGTARMEQNVSVRQDPRHGTSTSPSRMVVSYPTNIRIGDESFALTSFSGLVRFFGALQRSAPGISDAHISAIVAAPRSQRAAVAQRIMSNLSPSDASAMRRYLLRNLDRVAFHDQLEAVRNPGAGVANSIARRLGSEGRSSLHDQFSPDGAHAPSALRGASSGPGEGERPVQSEMDRRVGLVFHRLEEVAQSADVLRGPSGRRLARLEARVRRWVSAATAAHPDPRELRNAERALRRQLLALLEMFD